MTCFLGLSWLFAKPTGTFMIWKCPAMPPNGRKGAKRVHGNASPSTVYRAHVCAMYRHDAKGPILFGIELSCTNFESTDVASTVRAPTLRQKAQQVFWASRPKFHFHPGLLRKGSWRGWWRKRKGSPRWFDLSHIGPYTKASPAWSHGSWAKKGWLHGSSLKKWSESRVTLNPVLNHHRPFQNRHIPHSSPNPKIS